MSPQNSARIFIACSSFDGLGTCACIPSLSSAETVTYRRALLGALVQRKAVHVLSSEGGRRILVLDETLRKQASRRKIAGLPRPASALSKEQKTPNGSESGRPDFIPIDVIWKGTLRTEKLFIFNSRDV